MLVGSLRSRGVTRAVAMATLIVAGETIFLLPFVLPRIFRPTFLQVFGINNFELGLAFSAYGIVALISYLLGGPLADRFTARMLLTLALIVTGIGGLLLLKVPSLSTLQLLYAFWGISTILLFWAAMLKTTRIWGGEQQQGRAFGFLDAGRGLFAALLASLSVFVFEMILPLDVDNASSRQLEFALLSVVKYFIAFIFISALVTWYVIRSDQGSGDLKGPLFRKRDIIQVSKNRAIWLNAFIVLCAYVGYKCTDDFSLYAHDAFGYDDVEAAKFGTISFWIRPVAALAVGFLADKYNGIRIISLCFVVTLLGSLFIASGFIVGDLFWIIALTVALTSLGIYGIRGIYFALFNVAKVPLHLTGTAVGIISVVGFTPDIFMGPLMGYLIDRSPGATGHQHVFLLLAGFSLVGLIASLVFSKIARNW